MSTIAATNSLFEIDVELDSLLDEIEEQTAQGGEPAGELVARFQGFCSAPILIAGRFSQGMNPINRLHASSLIHPSLGAGAVHGRSILEALRPKTVVGKNRLEADWSL